MFYKLWAESHATGIMVDLKKQEACVPASEFAKQKTQCKQKEKKKKTERNSK